jgi:hypothetical protein
VKRFVRYLMLALAVAGFGVAAWDQAKATNGACVVGREGFCYEVSADSCSKVMGHFYGASTICTVDPAVALADTSGNTIIGNSNLGACCVSGACQSVTADSCRVAGGVFIGWGYPCTASTCWTPIGACCTAGVCAVVTEGYCDSTGGDYKGDGVGCGSYTCWPDTVAVVIPSPGKSGPLTSGSILPGCADTLDYQWVHGCDRIGYQAIYDADTVRYYIDVAAHYDGANTIWKLLDSTTVVMAATGDRWGIDRQLQHEAVVGIAHGPTFRSWMIEYMRIRLFNPSVTDTVKHFRSWIRCDK